MRVSSTTTRSGLSRRGFLGALGCAPAAAAASAVGIAPTAPTAIGYLDACIATTGFVSLPEAVLSDLNYRPVTLARPLIFQATAPALPPPAGQDEGQPVKAGNASDAMPERGVGGHAAGQSEEFVAVTGAGEGAGTPADPALVPDALFTSSAVLPPPQDSEAHSLASLLSGARGDASSMGGA